MKIVYGELETIGDLVAPLTTSSKWLFSGILLTYGDHAGEATSHLLRWGRKKIKRRSMAVVTSWNVLLKFAV